MVLKKIMIAMLGLLLMTTSQAQLFGADDATSKKLVKLLSKELHVDRSDLEFEKVSTAECLQTEQVESVLRVYKAGKPTGFVVSAIGKGRYDQFNYLVYYNEDREVKLVNVTAYFSDHGNEITSKRWLKQFNGYDGGDLDYGDEVQAISGATLSASSIVKGIREITILLQDCNL